MRTIYLDNASTTAIDKEVIDLMYESMQLYYGNPSSTHQFGRKAKSLVETARINIAKQFNVSASEIIFTAGGTEADNLIINNAVLHLGVQTIVTSKMEHHAVLHTVAHLQKTQNVTIVYVDVDSFGNVDLGHLEQILASLTTKTLVSLMYVNNEVGNILPITKVAEICKKHNSLFHSDTVQAIGFYPIDLQASSIDFITASAHKFHGPKGVGFAYFRKGFGILPMLHGGDQERGARSSTENVHAILGMEKALEISLSNNKENKKTITTLKKYFIAQLQEHFSDVAFNGLSDQLEKSTYKILNVRFNSKNDMLLFSLDLAGIAVSGGSACQSGSNKGSHVLDAILDREEADKNSIRFSFSKYNTKEEIDIAVLHLKAILK